LSEDRITRGKELKQDDIYQLKKSIMWHFARFDFLCYCENLRDFLS